MSAEGNIQVYQNNYKALLHEYPVLSNQIIDQQYEQKNIQEFPDTSGEPEISYDANCLENSDFVVIMGIGLDNSFLNLIQKASLTTTFLIVEKQLDLFIRLLRSRDISCLIEGWQAKFIINVSPENIVKYLNQYYFQARNPYLVYNRHSYSIDKIYYDNFAEHLKLLYPKRLPCPQPSTRKQYNFLMIAGSKGTGWPYIMQDIINAMNKHGHNVKVMRMANDSYRYSLKKEIRNNRPDYIFMLDCMGLLNEEFRKIGVPYISWFFDNPFNWLNESFVSDNYIIFSWDKTYVPDLKKAGFKNVYYLPLAANPDVFYKRRGGSAVNLSFVGSSLLEAPPLPFKNDAQNKFIELVARKIIETPWVPIETILENIGSESGIFPKFDGFDKLMDFEVFIQNYSRVFYRRAIIDASLEFNPSLYGDGNWQNITVKNKGSYMGRINNRIELPELYSSCYINLNITVPQLRDSLSHRAFEIPACGGFLLSDYRPEAEKFFSLDKEIVCFKNTGELKEKIRFYLKNHKDREYIAENGLKRVMEEHTYFHRIKDLVSVLDNL